MKSAKELLKEMGFNPKAPYSTQNAFLKNLMRAAQIDRKAEVFDLTAKSTVQKDKNEDRQLSFDFSKLSS